MVEDDPELVGDTTPNERLIAHGDDHDRGEFRRAHTHRAKVVRGGHAGAIRTSLLAFLHTRCFVAHPTQVTKQHLEGYLADLDRRGFTGSTRRL
jgi:hypothetical protein